MATAQIRADREGFRRRRLADRDPGHHLDRLLTWRCRSTTSSTVLARPFFGWVSDQIGREVDDVLRLLLRVPSACWVWASSAATRCASSFLPRASSSPGAKSTVCSRRPAPIPSARNSRPRMPACSTPPKAPAALAGPDRQPHRDQHRQLACGFRHGRHHGRDCSRHGGRGAEADAQGSYREALNPRQRVVGRRSRRPEARRDIAHGRAAGIRELYASAGFERS